MRAVGFAIRGRVGDQAGVKNSSIEIQNRATITAIGTNAIGTNAGLMAKHM